SSDGAGSQLATVDSNLVSTRDVVGGVEPGAVHAPDDAHSARVRIMLRPSGVSAASVAADNVYFQPSAAPAPTPTTTPRATATPVASLQPTPVASPPVAAAAQTPRANTPAPSGATSNEAATEPARQP